MKKVTELVKKQEKEEPFTKDDLTLLYELNAPIEGFGYEKDPRIAELRDTRDVEADLPVLFDCAPEGIAHNVSEIKDITSLCRSMGCRCLPHGQKISEYTAPLRVLP